jgi:hypothetical protein
MAYFKAFCSQMQQYIEDIHENLRISTESKHEAGAPTT